MKLQHLSYLAAIVALMSCGGGTEKQEAPAAAQETVKTDISTNPDYQKGLALVAKSDCLGCHKIEDKLVGPSYVDVANKYPSTTENITMLANTIIKGVTPDKAIWGKLPMSPHPQLSQADAEQMVKYVLLLKK
ncbi:c-type cytochrome [Parasediminibacterium sp. JCM 36343]|uniref:c-type cytochrome n=1 Tax=Parasediminibacterium sp. JCM 36343 TaxID=3374279 RepID=UPI0039795CDA